MYKFISEQSIYQYFGEDEPEMIREMVQIILETNIKDLKELDIFYKQNSYTTIKNLCHKAKPTMVYIGALKTRKILEEIEKNPSGFPELNESLQADLIGIETELNQFLIALN
ncbi:Hpt domain-containing protein [Algoriphagus sp. Y33]|uniref:Hpt domain-containing protein n=1 Tax=Algoriphagus sp. Y33 TaxID=2772483 RepID=UPI0017849E3C|nr:Hpt domain-containing protein [Algoriphagus sp. Y33]